MLVKINGERVFRGKDFVPIALQRYVKNCYGGLTVDGEVLAYSVEDLDKFFTALWIDCRRYLIYKEKERYNNLKLSGNAFGDLNRDFSDKLKKVDKYKEALGLIEDYEKENPILILLHVWESIKESVTWDKLSMMWLRRKHKELILVILKD